MLEKRTLIQFAKYGIIGVSNTLITAIVIWVLLKQVNALDWIANFVGYVAGILNSFVWNRKWTFSSAHSWTRDFFRIPFGFCSLLCHPVCISVLAERNYVLRFVLQPHCGDGLLHCIELSLQQIRYILRLQKRQVVPAVLNCTILWIERIIRTRK